MAKKDEVMVFLEKNQSKILKMSFEEVSDTIADKFQIARGTAKNYYAAWKSKYKDKEKEKDIDEAASKILDIIEKKEEKTVNEMFKETQEERKELKKELCDSVGKDHKEEEIKMVKKSKLKIKSVQGEHAEYIKSNNGIVAKKNNFETVYKSIEEINEIEKKSIEETIRQIKEEAEEVREAFILLE